MHLVVIPILILMAILFALAIMTGVTVFVVGDIFLLVVFFLVIARTAVLERRRRGVFILQCIEHTMQLNAPLPDMMNAAAHGESSVLSGKLRRLSDYLENGMGVADAIDITACGVSDRAIRLIRAAERTGRLQPQLNRIIAEERRISRSESLDSILMFVYPASILTMLLLLMGGVSVFIFPKFTYIFEDFDAELPPLTRWLMQDGAVYMPIVFLVAAVVCCGFIFKMFWDLLRGGSLPNLIPGMDWMKWNLPICRSAVRPGCYADAFALIADSLEAGQTLPGAIVHAESGAGNKVWKAQLLKWHRLLESGNDITASAKQAGMPNLLIGLMGTGQASGNLHEVLHFVARYYRSRFSRMAAVIRGTILPLMVTIAAVLVGLFVVSLLLPLASLIESTALDAI